MFESIKSTGQNNGERSGTSGLGGQGQTRQDGAERRHEAEARTAEIAEAIERLRALRRTFNNAPLDEILASRHEGHKY